MRVELSKYVFTESEQIGTVFWLKLEDKMYFY